MFIVVLLIQILSLDINECGANNGGCSELCTNTIGSFICSCQDGFVLHSDGFTCQGYTDSKMTHYKYTFTWKKN